jgi:hypothetical protein
VHHVGIRGYEFRHGDPDTVDAPAHDPAMLDPKIAPFRPTEIAQTPRQSRDASLRFWIVLSEAHYDAYPP